MDLLINLVDRPEPQDRPDPQDPGFPPGLPPGPPPAGGERTRAVDQSRERSRPRSPLPDPQLIHIPMSDGNDDQPPQTGRQGTIQVVSDHILTHNYLRNRKYNLHHQRDSDLQLSNEIAPEDKKDPDRVSIHLNAHPNAPSQSGQQPQHVVPRPGEPQTQPLASQDTDGESETVEPIHLTISKLPLLARLF